MLALSRWGTKTERNRIGGGKLKVQKNEGSCNNLGTGNGIEWEKAK